MLEILSIDLLTYVALAAIAIGGVLHTRAQPHRSSFRGNEIKFHRF